MARARWWRWGPALVYMALIFFSSSQSDPAPILTANVWDKLLHGSGYGLLALLYVFAITRTDRSRTTVAIAAILLTSLYAASDEIHQRYTAGRNPEIEDWLADTAGGAAAAVGYVLAARAKNQ